MFPEAWDGIAAFMSNAFVIVGNPTQVIGRRVKWRTLRVVIEDPDPVESVRFLVNDRADDQLIEWFLKSAWSEDGDGWLAVVEQDPMLAADAWRLLSPKDHEDGFVRFVFADMSDEEIIVFTQQGVQAYDLDSEEGRALMPDPGPEWNVEVVV